MKKNYNEKVLPKYVRVGEDGCIMRRADKNDHTEDQYTYYRDAGLWGIKHKWLEDGTLVSISPFGESDERLTNLPLIKVTKEEWKKDNRGYI